MRFLLASLLLFTACGDNLKLLGDGGPDASVDEIDAGGAADGAVDGGGFLVDAQLPTFDALVAVPDGSLLPDGPIISFPDAPPAPIDATPGPDAFTCTPDMFLRCSGDNAIVCNSGGTAEETISC